MHLSPNPSQRSFSSAPGVGEQLEPYERICAYVELDVLRDNMIRMKRNLSKETKMLFLIGSGKMSVNSF